MSDAMLSVYRQRALYDARRVPRAIEVASVGGDHPLALTRDFGLLAKKGGVRRFDGPARPRGECRALLPKRLGTPEDATRGHRAWSRKPRRADIGGPQ